MIGSPQSILILVRNISITTISAMFGHRRDRSQELSDQSSYMVILSHT